MRVAVVDIGTNSTRLLLADVDPATGTVVELERRSTVTRLGQGVDETGALAEAAIDRVVAVLSAYRDVVEDRGGAEADVAILTSATRDADNGPAFTARVRDDFGLDARTITGDEEAALTFAGATGERSPQDAWPAAVVDVGGGSTELVVGDAPGEVRFHVSTQAGVVRHGERHVHHDPPLPRELEALAADARAVFAAAVPEGVRDGVRAGIAVAGTATSLAAIAQELDPYDPIRVHGYHLTLAAIDALRDRLAALAEPARREVAGLQPDRAPTIVPGCVLLGEALRALGLDAVEVSEHDVLRGAALMLARR